LVFESVTEKGPTKRILWCNFFFCFTKFCLTW